MPPRTDVTAELTVDQPLRGSTRGPGSGDSRPSSGRAISGRRAGAGRGAGHRRRGRDLAARARRAELPDPRRAGVGPVPESPSHALG